MARMIPPVIPRDAAPGERLVFQRLASDPASEGWTVLHSLNIAAHVRQAQGEADFVVIAPGLGIAVIEVKSHRRIARQQDGQWVLGSQLPTSRSPFQQASESMHSIRKYLSSKRVDLRLSPMVHGVWFTHVQARADLPPSPEWHDWQLLDRDDFRTGAAAGVARLLDRGRQHLAKRLPAMAASPAGPDAEGAAAIVAALRPRFELASGMGTLRRERQSQMTAFLDEQYEALDALEGNRCVLITGPAGSGKTFLALEAARREAAAGRAGWLLCFNRHLGAYLRNLASEAQGVRAGSLHGTLLRLTGTEPPPGAGEEFWRGGLVDGALERLLDVDEALDYLIVDEVQDLARPEYLDVLDLLVTGGLAGGRCLLFGDFERQALYGRGDGRQEIRDRTPGSASFELAANCRNLPRIGSAAEVLAAMSPGYRRFRRQDDGAQPRYYWYTDAAKQSALLARAVRELRDEGFALEEIAVLSPRRAASAAAGCTDPWLQPLLVEGGGNPRKGKVPYSTVHAFKGLEAPAVVLTDIDDPTLPGFEAMLYVGLTRPTDRLSILATKAALSQRVLA